MNLEAGTIVANKYRVERVLGRGGMGVVFEATHLSLELRVALKVLLAEAATQPGATTRFLREARAVARLQSEHVARVLDVDQLSDGRPYIVMEHLVGQDLHQLSRSRGPLPVAEAVSIVLSVCDALAEAHALGIVHRDLKPSNVFLAQRRDGSTTVKLLDFGVAKAPASWAEPELTQSMVIGSPSYMSPEQLRESASVDARSDVWALGVMLHELLSLRHPFEANSHTRVPPSADSRNSATAVGARVMTSEPTPLRAHRLDAPPGLEAIVARCLSRDPAGRFSTVGALATALQPFAEHTSVTRIVRLADASSTPTVAVEPPPSSRAEPPESRPISSVRTPTENFRRQHEELASAGAEILQLLEGDDAAIVSRSTELRRKVARFGGKLKMHASMETDALYPRLLEHRDPKVRSTADGLLREVKDLYGAFDHFVKRWPDTASIEADPRAFAKDTRKMLKTLWLRMCRENDELYPLADAAG